MCHVSAVSRGRFLGNCFPQFGPQLLVITGEAITSRYRSSPILMEWSTQCNDSTKVLTAAGSARQYHQQCKGYHKLREHRSGSGGLSEYRDGANPYLQGDLFQAKETLTSRS